MDGFKSENWSSVRNASGAAVRRDSGPGLVSGVEPNDRADSEALRVAEAAQHHARRPLFSRYHILGAMERRFDVEIGIAVAEPVTGSGPVAGEIPGGTYAAVVHHGHPDGIFKVCEGLESWASENGVEFDNERNGQSDVWAGRFEFYLTNPDDEPYPNKWSTEIADLTTGVGNDQAKG